MGRGAGKAWVVGGGGVCVGISGYGRFVIGSRAPGRRGGVANGRRVVCCRTMPARRKRRKTESMRRNCGETREWNAEQCAYTRLSPGSLDTNDGEKKANDLLGAIGLRRLENILGFLPFIVAHQRLPGVELGPQAVDEVLFPARPGKSDAAFAVEPGYDRLELVDGVVGYTGVEDLEGGMVKD